MRTFEYRSLGMMMTNSRRTLLLLVATLIAGQSLHAQKVGTTSMQFLKVIPSARGTGVGEAYSVWAEGADALFWNPGGLAAVHRQEFSLSYIDWLFDTQQGAFSYARSLDLWGAVGLQIQYVDFGVFEETTNDRPSISNPDAPGMTGRTFRPFSYVVGISYARSLTDKFSLGLSMKYARESLFDGQYVTAMITQGQLESVKTWGSGLLFDFGIRYNTGYRSIQLASAVQNFGADITYAKESHPAPLLFRFGVAADLIGPQALFVSGEQNNRLGVAFDIFHPNDYSQQIHVGVEYELASFIALRAGYKFNYDVDGLTLGGGITHTIGGMPLSLDYSYAPMGVYLGGVQRLSLGMRIP